MNVSPLMTNLNVIYNQNSIFLVLNNEDLGLSGNNPGNKLLGGMHIKTEDGCSDMGSDNFGPMNQGGSGGGPGSCRMMSQTSPERIQPLPSNVVNKQSNSMEVSATKPIHILHRILPKCLPFSLSFFIASFSVLLSSDHVKQTAI